MEHKSLNDFAPLYLKNLFTRNSHRSSRALRNTQSDLKLSLKKTSCGQKDFLLGERKLGTVYQLLQKGAINKIF